jgi:DNA-binding SARP family transcriptional activator/tetratricopeptide (TPR) repeat protein
VAVRAEFGLLGPVVVRCEGAVVPVAGGRQSALLAALLLDAGHLVTMGQLTDVLWGATPPAGARAALHNQVKRLRDALGAVGRDRVRTRPGGYLIHLEPGELDVARMQDLLASARMAARSGAWDRASAMAAGAVLLWRGEPLAGVDSEVLARRIPDLTELYLQAVEIRLEAEVSLGRHAEVISELRRLTADQPFREHAHALLMLALYRCGRQGEALAAYQAARRLLVDELGSEPGPDLRALHRRILAADPALAPPGAENRPPAPARSPATELETAEPAGKVLIVPRQLPAPVRQFVGRERELAVLTGLLGQAGTRPTAISAIGGTPGVGKTALAVHFGHQAAGLFPDGQLYVNLAGFGPSGSPLAPGQAVRGFLDALGVGPEQVPADLEGQAGLYRSLLAGRRMLVVLDNAADEQQVRPLLPGSPGCLAVVTSRRQLAGLAAAEGAALITLDCLPQAEALQLLAVRVGAGRVAAEPGAAGELVTLCAGLPLALAIAAARAAVRPGFSLAGLAAELRQADNCLNALDAGDQGASIRPVFSWSYRALGQPAARMFALLGLHPGPDVSVPAAASLAGLGRPAARVQLDELTSASLLTEHQPGRYGLHDLLRAYAAEQAAALDSREQRAAAGRVLDHYLHTAHIAARLLNSAREPISLTPPAPGTTLEHLATHQQALAWFEAEHHVLPAAITLAAGIGFDTYAWQIPWAMAGFLEWRGHWQEWAALQRTALAATARLSDAAGQAMTGRLLASACGRLGDYEEARTHLADCLRLYQQLGNRPGEARVHQHLSWGYERQGRYADALGHAQHALELFQAEGDRAGQADALNCVGWSYAVLGDYQRARTCCRQALSLQRELGNRYSQAATWDSLGYAEYHAGHLAEATACYQHALSLFRELGDLDHEAETLTHMGDTHFAAKETGNARRAWHQALAILDDLGHHDAAQIRAKLASTNDHAFLGTRPRSNAPLALASITAGQGRIIRGNPTPGQEPEQDSLGVADPGAD